MQMDSGKLRTVSTHLISTLVAKFRWLNRNVYRSHVYWKVTEKYGLIDKEKTSCIETKTISSITPYFAEEASRWRLSFSALEAFFISVITDNDQRWWSGPAPVSYGPLGLLSIPHE